MQQVVFATKVAARFLRRQVGRQARQAVFFRGEEATQNSPFMERVRRNLERERGGGEGYTRSVVPYVRGKNIISYPPPPPLQDKPRKRNTDGPSKGALGMGEREGDAK